MNTISKMIVVALLLAAAAFAAEPGKDPLFFFKKIVF